eukprot:302602-Chlamydomonas_euryale.AAC.2
MLRSHTHKLALFLRAILPPHSPPPPWATHPHPQRGPASAQPSPAHLQHAGVARIVHEPAARRVAVARVQKHCPVDPREGCRSVVGLGAVAAACGRRRYRCVAALRRGGKRGGAAAAAVLYANNKHVHASRP